MATRASYNRSAVVKGNYGTSNRERYTRSGQMTAQRNMYVGGSAAPELEPERRQRPDKAPQRQPKPQPRKVLIPRISVGSVLILMAMMAVTIGFCVNYLHTQSRVTNMKAQVAQMQQDIAQARVENEEEYQTIMDSVDLAQVYALATGQLGMVQAVDNQVYKYKSKKSDMVKQYAEIPSAK